MNIDKYEYPDLKPLDQDWRWCHKYCYDVIKGNIPAGLQIKLAAERHFKDMESDKFYFDEEAANSIVLWFNYIPITDGKKAGSPTILLPWQIWIVVSLIAFKWAKDTFDEDGNELTVSGERRFNQTFILIARKAGKTVLAAGMMLYLMYKSGYQPRAFSLATKRDQAKLLWGAAKTMINLSPRLKTIFENRANEILMPNKEGVFKALASDANSLDGLNPIAASLDEAHAIKNRDLYGVIISAFGAQTEYLMITITTAGFVLDGICTDLYKNGCRVLDPDDDVEQDNYFYAIFQIDKGDDWTDPQSWYKSNAGLIYGLPRMKYIRDRLKEAQMTVAEKGNFLTKHCNLFVSSYDKFLDMDQVRDCRDETLNFDDHKHKKCWIGYDRAHTKDLNSASVLFSRDDGGIDVFLFNMLPKVTVSLVSDYLRQIYNKAESEGDLDLVVTDTVRDESVERLLINLYESLPNCEGIFYDPYQMSEIAISLEKQNIPIIAVSQTTGNMSESSKKLEGLIIEGMLHYNSTMFEYACSCAMMKITQDSNMKVYRDNDKIDKIDPLIATIIALSAATLTKIDRNVYEDRGMIIL